MADKKEGASLFSMNLGGKSKRITKFPEKTTINLVRFETEKSHTMDFLVVLLLLLCLVAFAKFFVYDQFTALQNAQRQYSAVQDQLFSLRQNNSAYSDVKAEYDRVTEWYMTEAEKNIIDKREVLKMLEEDLMPYVELKSISVAGTIVSVQTGITTLEVVSEYLIRLQNDPRNRTATVTTTSAAGNSGVKGTVTSAVIIDFIGGPGPNEQEASSGAETAADASGASGQNGGEA